MLQTDYPKPWPQEKITVIYTRTSTPDIYNLHTWTTQMKCIKGTYASMECMEIKQNWSDTVSDSRKLSKTGRQNISVKCSRADSRIRKRLFADVSGNDCSVLLMGWYQISAAVLPSNQQHPEDGDWVSPWNVGEMLHLDKAVCSRRIYSLLWPRKLQDRKKIDYKLIFILFNKHF